MAESDFIGEVKSLFQEFLIEERKRTDGLFQRFEDHCRADMGQVYAEQRSLGTRIQALETASEICSDQKKRWPQWVHSAILVVALVLAFILGKGIHLG